MNFRLKYSLNTAVNTTAGNDSRNYFGLYEYLNRVPLYSDQMFLLYRRARVTGVKITYEFINISSTQVSDIICCVVPYSDRNSITTEAARQRPRSIWKTAGLGPGMSRVVISKRFNSQYYMGESVGPDSQRWMTPSTAGNTAPLDVNDPVILMIAAPSSIASGVVAQVNMHVEYDVRYFDLTEPGISFKTKEIHEDHDEDAEDDFQHPGEISVSVEEYRQLVAAARKKK